MIAQRKYEEIRPIMARKGKKKASVLRSFVANPMVCVLAVTMVVCLAASMYVGAYAGCTEKGRNRAKLMSDFTKLSKENEKLRMDVESLRQPEQIEAYAKATNMKVCQTTAYLPPIDQPRMAEKTASADIQ
ncbi:MAG TPA: hypothetical protein VGK34_01710 [Armatimonadota bacterium]|jgi:cell division protein FtsL